MKHQEFWASYEKARLMYWYDQPIMWSGELNSQLYIIQLVDSYLSEVEKTNGYDREYRMYMASPTTQEIVDKVENNKIYLYEAIRVEECLILTEVSEHELAVSKLEGYPPDDMLPSKNTYLVFGE